MPLNVLRDFVHESTNSKKLVRADQARVQVAAVFLGQRVLCVRVSWCARGLPAPSFPAEQGEGERALASARASAGSVMERSGRDGLEARPTKTRRDRRDACPTESKEGERKEKKEPLTPALSPHAGRRSGRVRARALFRKARGSLSIRKTCAKLSLRPYLRPDLQDQDGGGYGPPLFGSG